MAWGGLEMNVLRFLRWMRDRGWDTVLCTCPDSALYRNAIDSEVSVRPVKPTVKYTDFFKARRLARQICKDNVRVLTVSQSRDILFGALVKRFSRKSLKLIYSQHMHIGGDKKDFLHSWEYAHFDAWVTPVQWLADRVLDKTTVPLSKIHIIPHGIELKRFTLDRPDKKTARRKLGIDETVTLAGIIGRLDPKKCQHVVIKVLKKVHEAGHPLHLLVVGDRTLSEWEDYDRYLEQLVDELNLCNFVHFRPHQQDPEYAFAALDLFVLASQSETYGMVTIEALASGLPVIGTSEGGTLDLISHEKNGLLFTPMNEDELTEAMLRYITDSDFATRMAKQAKQDAIERFSHIRQCESWERLLDEIVE